MDVYRNANKYFLKPNPDILSLWRSVIIRLITIAVILLKKNMIMAFSVKFKDPINFAIGKPSRLFS